MNEMAGDGYCVVRNSNYRHEIEYLRVDKNDGREHWEKHKARAASMTLYEAKAIELALKVEQAVINGKGMLPYLYYIERL
jgi:hypothetical protein